MARYITKVRTKRSPEEAFAYLADLRNFAEWDPGVRRVAQVEGDGAGPDAVFDVTVASIGRDLTLRYRTAEYSRRTVCWSSPGAGCSRRKTASPSRRATARSS